MFYKYDPDFHAGAKVKIKAGEFKNLEGVIVKFKATLFGNWYIVKLANGKNRGFSLEEIELVK